MNDNETIVVPVENSSATPQQMPQGGGGESQVAAIMMMADIALRRPRNEALAERKMMESVDDSSVWAIPNRGSGPSIKIARTALQHYKNAAVFQTQRDIMIATDEGLKPGWEITVHAVDLENVVIATSVGQISRMPRKPGEKDLAYEQRLFQLQLAFIGRLERNAIFKILPGDWGPKIMNAHRRKTREKPLETRIAKSMNEAESIGISAIQVSRLYNCPPKEMSEGNWADLSSRLVAVRTGELSVEDAFEEVQSASGRTGGDAVPNNAADQRTAQTPPAAEEKPKRKRRTKAEIQADKEKKAQAEAEAEAKDEKPATATETPAASDPEPPAAAEVQGEENPPAEDSADDLEFENIDMDVAALVLDPMAFTREISPTKLRNTIKGKGLDYVLEFLGVSGDAFMVSYRETVAEMKSVEDAAESLEEGEESEENENN